MDGSRSQALEEILDNLYSHWRNVRRETINGIGEREALKIIDFHANNWIDIMGWISSRYQKDEQINDVHLFVFLIPRRNTSYNIYPIISMEVYNSKGFFLSYTINSLSPHISPMCVEII